MGNVLVTTAPGIDASHPANPTKDTYTNDNRVLKETRPDGSWTQCGYDAGGDVTSTITSVSSPSNLTTAIYDVGGRRTSYTDGNGLATTYTYDDLGRQISAETGAGTSTFIYNTMGWEYKIQDADGFTTSRVYDHAGRLTVDRDRANLVRRKRRRSADQFFLRRQRQPAAASFPRRPKARPTARPPSPTISSVTRIVTSKPPGVRRSRTLRPPTTPWGARACRRTTPGT